MENCDVTAESEEPVDKGGDSGHKSSFSLKRTCLEINIEWEEGSRQMYPLE